MLQLMKMLYQNYICTNESLSQSTVYAIQSVHSKMDTDFKESGNFNLSGNVQYLRYMRAKVPVDTTTLDTHDHANVDTCPLWLRSSTVNTNMVT